MMTQLIRTIVFVFAAILGTGTCQAQTSISDLLDRLRTAQGDELMQVIQALGQSHDRKAVQPLLDIFDVAHTGLRQSHYIVIALGELKDDRAIPKLRDAWIYLKSNDLGGSQFPVEVVARYQLLREAIMTSLGEIGGDSAIEVLVSGTRDDQKGVVERACRALKKLKYNRMADLDCPPSR